MAVFGHSGSQAPQLMQSEVMRIAIEQNPFSKVIMRVVSRIDKGNNHRNYDLRGKWATTILSLP
jgi:beta-lactamase class D